MTLHEGTLSGDPSGPATVPPGGGAAGGAPLDAPDLEIERELGRGGMGVVWKARQLSLDRDVAVKGLRDIPGSEQALRFACEARITGRLEHPSIPPVHFFGTDGSRRPFLCMKLVRGTDWGKLLAPKTTEERERAAKLDLRAHLAILVKAGEAVAFAHSRGVIHRDLKPANIMVGEFGEVHVMDWGVALDLTSGPAPAVAPGEPRHAVGTPAYMAPELASGIIERMGPWTDVYLLGAVLYELLTGTPPHRGTSVMDTLNRAAEGTIDPPRERAPDREVPAALAEVALRAMQRLPEQRYPGALAFVAAIDEVQRNEASVRLATAALASLERLESQVEVSDASAREVYAAFAACIAELTEATRLWPANRAADDGLVRARLAYARCAIAHGDIALAGAQLAEAPVHDERAMELRRRITEIRAAERSRRRKVLAALAAAAIALVIAGAFGYAELRRARAAEAARDRRARAVAAAVGYEYMPSSDQIKAYLRGLAIDGDWVEGLTGVASAYASRAYDLAYSDPVAGAADLEAAIRPLDRALELRPAAADILLQRGGIHEARGDWARASADYTRALALDPTSRPGHSAASSIALAAGRFAAGRFAEAERESGAAIAIEEVESDVFQRGLVRFILGDIDGALADARRCEEITPRDEWYHALSALALLAAGHERAASAKLLFAVRTNPHTPHVLRLLAFLAARHGDRPRAEALWARARTARDMSARCYLGDEPVWRSARFAGTPHGALGRAAALEGDLDVAAPATTLALRMKAEERLRAGTPADLEGALSDVDRALADDPSDGDARLLRARCLARLGHPGAAREELAVVPLLSPHRAIEAGELLRSLGDRE
jgi:hypothetical protein